MATGNESNLDRQTARGAQAAAGTLLLSRGDVERLLAPDECIAAVEEAFRQHALGKAPSPGILGMRGGDGSFHVKAAFLAESAGRGRAYFAAKINANFPQVGADSEDKQEIDPQLLACCTLVTDLTRQCAAIGDLHHAIAAGAMTLEGVHAELGQIVAGLKPARTSSGEIIVFDSSGTALQDAAAAIAVYQRALPETGGERFHFNA